jgi:hypothetical protein
LCLKRCVSQTFDVELSVALNNAKVTFTFVKTNRI